MTLLEYKQTCEESGIPFDEGFYRPPLNLDDYKLLCEKLSVPFSGDDFKPGSDTFLRTKFAIVKQLIGKTPMKCFRSTNPYLWIQTPSGWLEIVEDSDHIAAYLNGKLDYTCCLDNDIDHIMSYIKSSI